MRLAARIAGIAALTIALVSFAAPGGPALAAPPKAKPAASAKVRRDKTAKKPAEKAPKGPLSVGAPNGGKLIKGEKLTSNRSIEVRGGGHAYGTPELVQVLKRAAFKVRKKHKGSVLFVGDLSAKRGGPLFGHNSHQSGRDADVGFYMEHADGKHVNPHRFIPFGGDGRARDGAIVRFDDERNWAFVEALITDPKVEVRYVFVSMGLRKRLLTYAAQKKKVSKDIYTRAAAALMSPADVDVHDDHFHVRIACPEKMRPSCIEDSYLTARKGTASASTPKQPDATAAARAKEAKEEAAKPVKEAKEAETDEAPAEGSDASD
ncbi:MAG: penicillin-insensitive murein endopeptidase [Polyangiaceae bacterium]|nr:penicillin-insensitive murein endopeptidase [Polyangiaceae bacterium]